MITTKVAGPKALLLPNDDDASATVLNTVRVSDITAGPGLRIAIESITGRSAGCGRKPSLRFLGLLPGNVSGGWSARGVLNPVFLALWLPIQLYWLCWWLEGRRRR